ncbi:MAG: DUF1559 domain-containing protein [Gemmataceae bacterium]
MRNYITAFLLFVVLSLTGLLIISAIGKIRDAANRMSCINNLHQVGLAVCNYRGTMERYPNATWENANLEPESRLSWLVTIVPYVESDDLYLRIQLGKSWDSEENRIIAVMPYRILQCPGYLYPPADTFYSSHYLGISGLQADAATLASKDPHSGFFGYERSLKRQDIVGCESHLLIALETSHAAGAWTAGGPPTVRGIEMDFQPYLGSERPFGGNHANVTNALFADASVRSFANSIDSKVIEAAATIQGSKEIEEFPD